MVDDQGAVSVRSLDGFTAMMQATSPEGWIQWTKTYPTFGPFDDAVLMGNTIVAARAGTFVTIDRATGQQLVSNVVYLPNLPATLATDGARVFFAYSDFSSNVFWGCVVLGSTPIWVRSAEHLTSPSPNWKLTPSAALGSLAIARLSKRPLCSWSLAPMAVRTTFSRMAAA
ncbi:MAG: hypothetical protein IPG92_17730 [Flavobacteriales bacterium]|nr:hypothetical protein [Flavobacteriales bacterium]